MFKRQRGAFLQNGARLRKRIHSAPAGVDPAFQQAVDGLLRRRQDHFRGASGEQLLRQTLGEPRGNFGGADAGVVAVGQLQQHRAGEGAGQLRAGHNLRQFDAAVPDAGKTRGDDGDIFIGRRLRMQREKNPAAPRRRGVNAQFAPERFFDALGGNSQQRRIEPDKVVVGDGDGREILTGVDDDELSGNAAANGGHVRQRRLGAGNGGKKQRAGCEKRQTVESLNR